MSTLTKTIATGLLSLSTAFPAHADQNVTVEKMGDVIESIDRSALSNLPQGVFKLTFKGANTNGEDLPCIYIQQDAYSRATGGLSCNWTPKAPGK